MQLTAVSPREKIAIIGMGCRFPGQANSYQQFFANLLNGQDAIIATPKNRYHADRLFSLDKAKAGRLTGGRGGYIDGFDEFDPAFFGIGAREAECMDPQQRKLLEVTFEALEDAGQKPFQLLCNRVGVFIGAFTLDYKIVQFADLSFKGLSAHTATGTMMTMVSNRLSYCFNLIGPSMSIDTACSSSLVAIHLACVSLLRRESKLAIAGGTLLHMTPQYTVAESKGGFLSPDGRSLAFDARANGYVRSEGVGVVVLKRLEDALFHNDQIHGVIIGSGVNQDGKSNGITAPSGEAQERLIEEVCEEASIVPGDLQYVEAHGTSTPVGDPIEANALGRVLKKGRAANASCYVGSVKTNIGHTEAAAGVAGLIKTVLALKQKIIPPHINLETLNPEINLSALPFDIPRMVAPWPAHEGPARAGVNSFGFGGTNAHVLLEEPPLPLTQKIHGRAGPKILMLSARDDIDRKNVASRLVQFLKEQTEINLDDVVYTAIERREIFTSRLAIIFNTRADLIERLETFVEKRQDPRVITNEARPQGLVFVFTGMGPQWWAMGRELYETEKLYRDVIHQCDQIIQEFANWSLIDELLRPEKESRMADTWLAQPANFAVQAGLLALWKSYGVNADAIVGHSTGEAAAFYAAGVYTLSDALKIMIHRSRLQQRLFGSGTMLAVSLTKDQASARIKPFGEKISIAAINSRTSITLSGEQKSLSILQETLWAESIFAKFLTVGVPYHSNYMDPIRDELLYALRDITPRRANTPLYLTGRLQIAKGPELDADYWWDNVRNPVQFAFAVDNLIKDGFTTFLEIGPHPVLASSIEECLADQEKQGLVIPSIRRQENEQERLMISLATLATRGALVDWSTIIGRHHLVTLPTYPWKKDRYWVENATVAQHRLYRDGHTLLGLRMPTPEPAWENELDVEQVAYLKDHKIDTAIVYPAAAYIEMASLALFALSKNETINLTDLSFKKALFLTEDESKTVQFSLTTKTGDFAITTIAKTGDNIIHCTGKLRSLPPKALLSSCALDKAKINCTSFMSKEDCYENLHAFGYHYGPRFQAIDNVWLGDNQALAKISCQEEAHQNFCHPIVIDACFQTVLSTEIGKMAQGTLRLPLTVDEIIMKRIGTNTCYAHALIRSRNDDEIVSDITVYNEEGEPRITIKGFRAGNIERASTSVSNSTIDSWLTKIDWRSEPALPAPISSEHPWLIFADRRGLSDHVVSALKQRQVKTFIVKPGEELSLDKNLMQATLRLDHKEDFRQIVEALLSMNIKKIIYLWPLDRPALNLADTAMLSHHHSFAAYPLLLLGQALIESKANLSLYIVTHGACSAADEITEPMAATIWGVGRVFWQQELCAFRGKLIDIDHDFIADNLTAERVIAEISSFDNDDEICLRDEKRFISRLVLVEKTSEPLPLSLRPDGYYLVTGAFGALGRLLTFMLAKRGARRIIMMNRTVLPDRKAWAHVSCTKTKSAIKFINEVEALGVEVILAPIDIADESALNSWLTTFKENHVQPIRGVFHLAGIVKDALLADMTSDDFEVVYNPKVLGSYLLHRALVNEPLDYFVLFSSVASVLTTAGQTNYAASNAFLDALAFHRRAQGQPAMSINWGPWATGMIEELGLIDHYKKSRGMTSLAPATGMDVLERIVSQAHPQLIVATIVDWPLFLSWYSIVPPLIASFAQLFPDANGEKRFMEEWKTAKDDDREPLLKNAFLAIVADVLRLNQPACDMISLNDLGLDSLLAIELRSRLQREFTVALPVVTLLSGVPIANLIKQILEELTTKVENNTDDAAHIAIVTNENEYPLTANQTALWFLKHLDPNSYAYNIGGAVRIRAQLSPELMFQAVRQMLLRHASLRANFMHRDGQALQIISPTPNEDIAFVDASTLSFDDVYQMIIEEYRKPYDLAVDPLMRFRLYRLGDDDFVMMKAVHHIISDAISTFTFIEELLEVYHCLKNNTAVDLPEVKARYLDFLNWQNRFLASTKAEKMLDYWLRNLPTPIPVLNLPLDKPRPAVQSHNGASQFFMLDEDLTAEVHSLAKQHNVTAFMVLLSAYYVLLYRYTGQEQVIVGSPVMGRTEQEFASVYGYFVNPLPLAVDLSDAPDTTKLLARVRQIVLHGLDNQEYPFVLLVDKLGLKHDPSRSRVFQAMFILLVHRVATVQYGYRLEYIELPEEEGQFDLTLSAYEDEAEGRFHCVFKYNSDLLVAETMSRMARHFVNIVRKMTISPNQSIASISLLDKDDLSRIIDDFSGQANSKTPEKTVLALFEEHARSYPSSRALSIPKDFFCTLNYGELEEKASRLAGALCHQGIKAGDVIAICLPKSVELIVAVLAIMKTRAAVLVLDPDGPRERLLYMLKSAATKLVFVDQSSREKLGNQDGMIEVAAMMSAPVQKIPAPPTLEDAAYIVFTSGSTGLPKAVKVSHQNWSAVFYGWLSDYQLRKNSRHAQCASLGFDVFFGDLARALGSGGGLSLIKRDLLFNTEEFYQALIDDKIDTVELVPSVAKSLIRYCEAHKKNLHHINLLIVGSDAWTIGEQTQLRALCHPNARLINSYGLSEATIDSTYFETETADFDKRMMVPIGKPFLNSEVYVLDALNQPVPIMVNGEIWVGGQGVATGYLNDRELTEKRFQILDINGIQKRLYRTGDLGHFDARGVLHLVGRIDKQVKIRGQRVEINEIEMHIRALPGIADAVVVVEGNENNNDKELHAYFLVKSHYQIDAKRTKKLLAEFLPTALIPTYFVEIEKIPLLENGKINYQALPRATSETAEFEAVRTFYEARMAYHWQKLLAVDAIGLNHDFFEMGGNSIKLIELIYLVQTEFNITIPVAELFKTSTLYGMAKVLEHIITGVIAGSKPYLEFNSDQKKVLFCFPPAGGHGLVYRNLAQHMQAHRLVSFNYLHGDDKIARYADLIEQIMPEGPYILFGYSLGGNLAFEVGKLLNERGLKVQKIIIMDSFRVVEEIELDEAHIKQFEQELREHLISHTGSSVVSEEMLHQARDFLCFCQKTLNLGTVNAPISVISDEEKVAAYELGEKGTWHESSQSGTEVFKGFGKHAHMLDSDHAAANALLTISILTDGEVHAE